MVIKEAIVTLNVSKLIQTSDNNLIVDCVKTIVLTHCLLSSYIIGLLITKYDASEYQITIIVMLHPVPVLL